MDVDPIGLEPGMSVYDEAFPLRARFVHSVERVDGDGRRRDARGRAVTTYRVRFGHPDGEPEDDPRNVGLVARDKRYHVIAHPDGSRPLG